MLWSLLWCLCGWEASYWVLHILSLSYLCLILPLLTIKDSILNGTKDYGESILILLTLSDLFLYKEISKVPLFTMVIDIVMGDPLSDDTTIPVEVIRFDFVQVEVRVNVTTNVVHIWLRWFAQVTTDKEPWAHANKVQLWGAQGEGAALDCPLEGNSHKGLILG